MTPKQEAKDLVDSFRPFTRNEREKGLSSRDLNSKQCALICVFEILKDKAKYLTGTDKLNGKISWKWEYWQEVKQEIDKL